jgi:predicted dehydrogenase
MPLNLTAEEKKLGQENFERVADALTRMTRRDFMKSLALTAGVVAPVGAAAYFQYAKDAKAVEDKPVKAALIGAGDEGGVLIGEHNPKYLNIVAVADIRPSNQKRIFTGDLEKDGTPKKTSPRKGLNHHYGRNADKEIRVYTDYKKLLEEEKEVEAVIIALPLFLHAPVAIDALNAGKHVLCEKLMAWNITQCKEMIAAAEKNDKILSIGHQRHYSMLYAHAVEVIDSGILGELRHIRALWHRNNAKPTFDKDGKEIPGVYGDSWKPAIPKEDAAALKDHVKKYGYKDLDELVRWRLYNRTGGGLMAELGSHQLDACSIFLGKVHPLAVSGVGGKIFYKDEREIDDHVFVTFEFPGKNYFVKDDKGNPTHEVKDKDDKVIVTYSSISTNQFEPYGECVTGNRGTLVVEMEQKAMLYPEPGGRAATVTVASAGGGKPALDTSGSTTGSTAAVGPISTSVSKGYREEIEHFAYCIRMREQGMTSDRPHVRCDGPHAMADAIIALTSNLAMKHQKRIEFQPEWFDPKSSEVPDAEMKPEVITG